MRDACRFLQHLARRLGKLKRGGAPDAMAAARVVLQDFNEGNISYFVAPPKDYKPGVQLSAQVVAEVRPFPRQMRASFCSQPS